jgi:small subunit ribosomal protein S16
MSVKIRLRRTGRKKQPSYRIVVADSATPRDGQYLDALGTYNPLTKPADLRIDMEKVEKWLANGAEMSDTAASLIRKARRGGDDKVAVRGVGPEIREEKSDVVPAAEPSRQPSRPGSRGAPKAAAAAEEPAAALEQPEAPADSEAAAPAAQAEAAPVGAAAPETPVAEATESTDAGEPADATEPADVGEPADAGEPTDATRPATGSAE